MLISDCHFCMNSDFKIKSSLKSNTDFEPLKKTDLAKYSLVHIHQIWIEQNVTSDIYDYYYA